MSEARFDTRGRARSISFFRGGFGVIAALFVWLMVAGLTHAQATTVEQLLADGLAARRAGNDAHALTLFTQAWEAGHSARARAQMGLAEQALGRFVDAERHLEEAFAVEGDEWVRARRESLQQGLESVRGRLGSLDVRTAAPRATLRINGRAVGELPLARPLRMLPGSVDVEVRAVGFASATRTVNVVAGELTRETFELTRTSPLLVDETGANVLGGATLPADPVTAPHARGSTLLPMLGVVGVTLGAVGLGVGAVVYLGGQPDADSWNSDECLALGVSREANCSKFRESAERAQTVSAISFVAGGALIVGGFALAMLASGDGDADSSTRAAAACAPVIGALTGVACEGRF